MNSIFSLGFILLLGLISARLINKIGFPSITAYFLLGILIGPSLTNIVSADLISASGFISNIVLGLIAFSIGQNFSRDNFMRISRSVVWISLLEANGAWVLVTLGIFLLLKQPFYTSLLFGGISTATAPAATAMIVREYKSRGALTDTLLGVVAIDDAWCLIIFAISLAVSKAVVAHVSGNLFILRVILKSLLGIGGAFFLGWVMSLLASGLSRFIRTQTEALIYALGFIFFTIGLSLALHFSVLLACMFLGACLVNLKGTKLNFFEIIRTIDSPLYIVFFVLAGANLEVRLLKDIGLLGLVYLIFRMAGKIGGVYLGSAIAGVSQKVRRYLGLCLVPQAGVALGCALIAKGEFPQVGGMIFTTIVATTIIYELIGPVFTKTALEKAGEIGIPG